MKKKASARVSGRAPRKASGRSSAAAGEDAERSPTPSRKETTHDRIGRMILEIAAAMSFKRSGLKPSQRPLYLFAFVDGARFVQAQNRERARQVRLLDALGIGADRPKGGVRSAAKDGTRAKPGASRATPSSKKN